jgi:hypothetical protein
MSNQGNTAVSRTTGPPHCSQQLPNCIRIYPHLNNTGGFFVALLRKKAPWPDATPAVRSSANQRPVRTKARREGMLPMIAWVLDREGNFLLRQTHFLAQTFVANGDLLFVNTVAERFGSEAHFGHNYLITVHNL